MYTLVYDVLWYLHLQLGLPLLFISAAGWIVYVVGFCLFYHEIR